MLTLDTSDTPLLRITAGGEVTREEVRRFYEEFEAALDIAGRAGLLVDLTGFEDIEPRAMLEDMVKEFGLLDDLARMPRCAVVTGNRTIAGMIRYTAPLVPRMDMQAFPPEEGAAAEAWARDLPPPRPGRKDLPGLTMLDSGSPDVLAFEVEGYIDDDHIDRITAPFRARLEQGGFEVKRIALIPRPTPLPSDMGAWLETLAAPILASIPETERSRVRDDTVALLRPALCDEAGSWTADYVRLRFEAVLRD